MKTTEAQGAELKEEIALLKTTLDEAQETIQLSSNRNNNPMMQAFKKRRIPGIHVQLKDHFWLD